MADNVKQINPDKHSPQKLNYNSGVVGMRCLINQRCPMLAKFLVDNAIVLNHETMKTFSKMDLKYFSAVPGLPGIHLKESYKYKSNFLYVLGKEVPAPVISQTSSEYKVDQSFNAVLSVFDTEETPPVTDIEESRNPSRNYKQALWGYVRHNQATDSGDTGGPSSNANEASDSNVLYIGQKAASVPGADSFNGIHWKIDKATNLFHGEDFFITFRQNTIATDAVNKSSSKSSSNTSESDFDLSNAQSFTKGDENPYYYLDVTHDSVSNPPSNQAVVSYKETEDGYEKVPDSAKFFYLANQSYYIIEMGPNDNGDIIFIIICSKAPPTCVLMKMNNGTPTTYNLGSYGERDGYHYIKQKEFTITVRNHLGNLVIYFNGNTSNPWIINPPDARAASQDGTSTDDVKKTNMLTVPRGRLSIWGGNIASSFCFSPLTYYGSESGVSVLLPPRPKTDASRRPGDSGEAKIATYEIPYSKEASGETAIDFAGIFLSNAENEYSASRNPEETTFYCDAHIINEIEFDLPESFNEITEMTPHFLDTGEFLKDTYSSSLTEVQNSAEDNNSMIRIEPRNLSLARSGNNGAGNIITFRVNLTLKPGHHYFVSTEIATASPTIKWIVNKDYSELIPDLSPGNFILRNCKTPIVPSFRIVAVPSDDAIAWSAGGTDADVSDLVMRYSESYSSSDFQTMNHTGTIKFLLNKNVTGVTGVSSWNNKVDLMFNNAARAFYVDVRAGYRDCNYSKLEEAFQLFTGICYGGIINEKPGETTMDCKIYDYSKILEESYIFNAPFQDGMRDFNAIHEFARMAGFRDKNERDPGYLLRRQSVHDDDDVSFGTLDGRGSWATAYALPNSYARLKSPFFKKQDGTPIWQAMKEIAQRGGKVIFFDTYGVLHYENLPYDRYLFNNGEVNDSDVLWRFTTSPSGRGQLVFDNLNLEKAVSDCFNVIHLVTSTPNREIAIVDRVNWPSVYDASSPGFLGYKKLYLQQEGIFGSLESLEKLANHYSKFFVAPTVVKFQTYGLPMRCFDLCTLEKTSGGRTGSTYLIITSINSEIDPSQNKWWSEVEGEWYGSTGF